MIRALCILWAASISRCGHARLLRPRHGPRHKPKARGRSLPPQDQTADDGSSIKLFCFAFFPRRDADEEKLPETRAQMAACDGYMLFTDEGAPGEEAGDIARIRVPEQETPREDGKWLWHRNMAGITPSWAYLLEKGLVDGYDWTINVELDHFLRPSKVRSTIREMLDMLGRGSDWERQFVTRRPRAAANISRNGTDVERAAAGAAERPMMFAFGNAFAFNRAVVDVMRTQWPLPGMTEDAGCPSFSKHCEQDMVYLSMLPAFEPPLQMFGTPGCGRSQALERGEVFPLGCWEMLQNPFGWDIRKVGEAYQLKAVRAIARQTPLEGAVPPEVSKPVPHFVHAMVNITDAQVEEYWPGTTRRRLAVEGVDWDLFLPSTSIPIIHHMASAAVLKEARLLLGL